ncbi:DUF6090 family protein [Sediminicola arcticus]|jgi:hypothetical protein|uniref:DUF6090 family protein n=1 Tax=Sediminicola arcticus TaxID=1574308 RepID=A0ABV2SUF4_9FLAO
MIKFFTKIRQNMITDNKFGKYLIYAVGEIILVVIGILIALQINNWNENRKAEKIELTYLIRLKNDLEKDTLYLENKMQYLKGEKAKIYQFVHQLYNVQKTEKEFKQLYILQSYVTESLVLQTSTYEELKNTGLTNIFQNESLKIEILDLYREYQIAADHFIEINNFTAREIFSKSASVGIKYYVPDLYDEKRLFEGTNWEFINDPNSESFKLIEDTQINYYIKYGYLIGHFEDLLIKSKSLFFKINKELSKEEDKV